MRLAIISILILFSSSLLLAQWHYPPTKTVDSADVYFGVSYKDPYRWLEYVKEPAVSTWFKEQASLTNSVVDNITRQGRAHRRMENAGQIAASPD